ncbi:hypothetical protein [Serratia liquefaciens]|uniref:hypothetical protein n=1 Tax=Serratia liquefaciens TaxID=614 RepID=UPI00301DEEF6
MDNKLSELSTPVAWDFPGSKEESRQIGYDFELDDEQKVNCDPLYSQEYVSALREDAAKWFKAFEKAVSVGARYEERMSEMDADLADRNGIILEQSKRIAELEADKRQLNEIINTEANRADAAEKQLVYSRYAMATWERKAISNFEECAKMSQCIEELEKRLATPVRLPETYWSFDDDQNPMFDADKVIAAIEGAGFKVEGDE